MSHAATRAVWQYSEQQGNRLLVMVAVADYTDENGRNAWPGVDKLAEKVRLSDTMVRTILKELVEDEELVIRNGEGPNGTHYYDIHPRIMAGQSKGPQKKTRPKNGQGKGWSIPVKPEADNTGFQEQGNTGLPKQTSEETRVSIEGNTGLQKGNTGSPNPSLSVIYPDQESDTNVSGADAPPPSKPKDPTSDKRRTSKTKNNSAPAAPNEATERRRHWFGLVVRAVLGAPATDKSTALFIKAQRGRINTLSEMLDNSEMTFEEFEAAYIGKTCQWFTIPVWQAVDNAGRPTKRPTLDGLQATLGQPLANFANRAKGQSARASPDNPAPPREYVPDTVTPAAHVDHGKLWRQATQGGGSYDRDSAEPQKPTARLAR